LQVERKLDTDLEHRQNAGMKWLGSVLCGVIVLSASAQDDARKAAQDSNAYAFDTFQLFRQTTDGNFCFSPYSVQRIAALLVEGAGGGTLDELIKLAHLSSDKGARKTEAKALSEALVSNVKVQGMTLDVANSIWAPAIVEMEPSFVEVASNQFAATVLNLPPDGPMKGAAVVNAWVRQKTRNRITSIIGPSAISDDPRTLVLVNAIYFRGRWSSPFLTGKTQPQAFQLPGGSVTPLPAMNQLSAFDYANGEHWQCLRMPLADGSVSMIALLPDSDGSRAQIEQRLSADTWEASTSALQNCDVNVMIPRFSFSTELSMKSMWQALGARTVFDSTSQLSGIASGRSMRVGDVFHHAMIEVTEMGAEAAATTTAPAAPFGDAAGGTSRRKVSFIANKPFIWAIRHEATGLILFLGRFAGK
jgi:serpin B